MKRLKIKLTDNDYQGSQLTDFGIDSNSNSEALTSLRFLAETTINEFADKQKENLLIFPHCLNASHKDIKCGDTIFSIQNNKIITSNYLGFVGYGNVEISITSRFDKGESNCFLHYMLQKVFAINLFDLQLSKENQSIWDFLIYLFPYYLKRAVRQGIFKKYQRQHYNDSKVRGTIDVSRHIRHNMPFNGKIAYSTREYSYDNNLTQLIRHTIEYINTHPLGGKNILRCDSETQQAVSQIIAATPSYNRNSRERILASNVKPERHPYFTEYAFLQQLCTKILRREKISLGGDSNEKVYGLIFDGAWLWEKYLKTVIEKIGFTHYDNKERKLKEYLFEDDKEEIYPDFYHKELNFVLDAKYKWKKDKIVRDDLFQIISYMHCLEADKGGLIYPKQHIDAKLEHEYRTLKGYGGNVYQFYLDISNSNDFYSFCTEMKDCENKLVKEIQQI